MNIIKKNGKSVQFDRDKLVRSILNAFLSVDNEISQYAIDKANNIADYIEQEKLKPNFSTEELGDLVEHGLMSCKRKDVAKSYVLKRDERDRERIRKTKLMGIVSEKLNASNVVNQNANVDEHSFGGRKGEAANELLKDYALNYCMSDLARNNHLANEIYIHDLDSYAIGSHNCLSIPFDPLLEKGFNTRQTDIRPAGSVSTALQLIAVVFQLQSLQQFGGVSATHLDWTLVPYVRKSFRKHYINGLKYIEGVDDLTSFNQIPEDTGIDSDEYKVYSRAYQYALDMTIKETKQAVEGMYHNLNTLQSRSGNQLPFTSINYGTCTLPEGRMIIRALLEGSKEGVGKLHRTPIFPCGIFQLMKGVNRAEGDPNYDLYKLALESTATRLYPNYANVDWSGNAGYDRNDPRTYFSTMGCRTANGADINALPGQNPQLKDGRGNICPVTIILPTLAMETKLDHPNVNSDELVDDFMRLLDKKIDEAKEMLIERFNYICNQSPESAKFMYENDLMYGYDKREGIRSALKHGTLAIGQLGLAETLQILIGHDHTSPEGMEVAKRIESLFKTRCAEFKQEYKLNFGVYYTPAENLCYTAMTKFKNKYGVIPNVSDREFFTNSIHVPVWKEISPFEKIDIESQLTGYSSAGCITYVELEGGIQNCAALEQIVNYAMDHDIPYFAINVPNDTCLECGYTGEFNDECPKCGSKHIQQLRRVTGYLTGDYKTAFNAGKRAEAEARYRTRFSK